ncbi:MAG: HlyC/CorC family transporter [Verrucomicrobia bacterium]|nr:HlyC/CorC family transporter [Verrucomicrobiota bacterium]
MILSPILADIITNFQNPEIAEEVTRGLEWYVLILVKFIAVFLLIAMNAFFVAAEFAIVKVRETQLEPLIKAGDKRAKTARFIIHHINPFLNTTQVGVTLASLGLGWIGEPVFAAVLEPVMELLNIQNAALTHTLSFAVGFSIITFLHIILGECTPKTVSISKPMESTLFVSRPLRLFYTIFYPAIWLLNESSIWMLKKIGLSSVDETESTHSEEELKLLLAGDDRKAPAGLNIVLNAFDLKHRLAREVMTPLRNIVEFSTEDSIEKAISIAESSRRSRFPLCVQGDLDQILGVIHIKDLYAMRHKVKSVSELKPFLKKALFVPENAHLEKLLFRLVDAKTHFAVVIDEYGGTIGIVTMENILEELVGQIQDEFDKENYLIQKIGEDEWELAGITPIHQLEEIISQPCEIENAATVGGLVTEMLSKVPTAGQTVTLGTWELTVQKVETDKRVETLRLKRIDQNNKEES